MRGPMKAGYQRRPGALPGGGYNEPATPRRRPAGTNGPCKRRSVFQGVLQTVPAEELRQHTEAGLRGLQDHNKFYGAKRSDQRLRILPYGGLLCGMQDVVAPYNARTTPTIGPVDGPHGPPLGWPPRSSEPMQPRAMQSPLADRVVPWRHSCCWPQRGNNNAKDHANNGMQRAQTPKGCQTNLPYSKWSALEYADEGAPHVVCSNISSKKTFKNANFIQKII